jgi:hypothetical protein
VKCTNPQQFYTYLWLRVDGTPYYVGKGHNDRAFLSAGHGGKRPKDRSRILIEEHPSEADAFAAEIFLIAYYGRRDLATGCLRNLTDGGDGPSGAVRTEAQRERHRRFMLDLYASGHIPHNKGKMMPEEQRTQLIKSHMGLRQSVATIQRRRAILSVRDKVDGTSSRYIGVSRTKQGWRAYVKVSGKQVWVGSYPTEMEAAQRRDIYVAQNGLKYRLNF